MGNVVVKKEHKVLSFKPYVIYLRYFHKLYVVNDKVKRHQCDNCDKLLNSICHNYYSTVFLCRINKRRQTSMKRIKNIIFLKEECEL